MHQGFDSSCCSSEICRSLERRLVSGRRPGEPHLGNHVRPLKVYTVDQRANLNRGMGKIGQQVSQRMKAFGMTVIYHNRSRLSADEEAMMGVSYASMDDLLSRSDVISLNCPLTPQTKHIINKDSMSKMKDGVMIVNTARGACIDTDALVEALKSGKVSRAGLDVFETEPEIPEYFKTSNKVMIMPHYLAFTKGTLERLENELLQNVEMYAATGRPKAAVNEP